MFARIKRVGAYAYLQLVRTERRAGRPRQRVLATLGRVERLFRDTKSLVRTRPIYHQLDETIRGHVFCSFLALVLLRELDRCLEEAGVEAEWNDVLRDLKALQRMELQEGNKRLWIRSQVQGSCAAVFRAVGLALPPVLQLADPPPPQS